MSDISPSFMPPGHVFTLRNFPLQSGEVLPEAKLVYQTYGTLNSQRNNAILYPTSYGAQHPDIDWLIGPDGILDSSRYFIIIPNMLGNGFSTSPSNLGPEWTSPSFPRFSHVDNVTLQRTMLQQQFGIHKLALVYGWSMGGQQALHWGALHPDAVERIAAICTSARTSVHNYVFLEGLKSALKSDSGWDGTRFTKWPERGLKAFGRIYAGWALSQEFYRKKRYLALGYNSLEDFLVRDWEASFLRRNPDNLLSMIETWQRSDISDNDLYRGDLAVALSSIQAQTLIMPVSTDLYFTPEDSLAEARQIPNAKYRVIPSCWGHRAGNPSKSPEDAQFIKNSIAELLRASSMLP